MQDNTYNVIIVGAGLAGLHAAEHLAKNGVTEFKILEARNRIGGRIVSISLGADTIELGANWIHGVLGNPIYELALSNKLIDINYVRKPHNVVATTEHGKRIPISVLQEVYETYFWFSKRCEEYFLCKFPCPPSVDSVGKHLARDIELYLKEFNEEDGCIRRMIFNHLLNRESCISGCNSLDDIELSDFGCYAELPGGNLTIPRGYSAILNCLTSSLPPDCILKEHAVKCIYWKHSTPTTPTEERLEAAAQLEEPLDTGQPKVRVECENGKQFCANHVIVTVPLGVLKAKVNDLFEPPLPDYKLQAIQKLSFGTVDKIFLEYERPFLHPDISEVITLWDLQPNEEKEAAKCWYRKIYSFMKVSETLLLAWLSGKEAEYAETLAAEEIADVCTGLLRKFLNDPYVPKPIRVVRTKWHSEPYTRGSYSAIAVGAKQSDIEHLSKPLYIHPYDSKPALLFAGEATHSTFFSTTHGAYLTGRTAAELLLHSDEAASSTSESDAQNLSEVSSWIRGISLDT